MTRVAATKPRATAAAEQRWDIELEPASGDMTFVVDQSSGKMKVDRVQAGSVRIRYRKLGSRGRFESFVVVGGLGKCTPLQVVKAYEADRVRRIEAYQIERSGQRAPARSST